METTQILTNFDVFWLKMPLANVDIPFLNLFSETCVDNSVSLRQGGGYIYIYLHLPLCQHALSTRLMCSGRSAFLQDVIVQCSMYIPQS